MKKALLEVQDLSVQFEGELGTTYAVNGVSFSVQEGEILGIVGESGCGKSVTALSLMRLVGKPGRITGGKVCLYNHENGRDLLSLSAEEMEQVRGNAISMIFQDPMTSLNPVLTIGYQLMEPLKIHRQMSSQAARAYAVQLLDRVGIPEASRRLDSYPHQFSGGMRQRVMIAMAVACNPKLLIADEPTTALDVTIQAQILDLLRELREELHTSIIIITHDLGVVATLADHIVVMYAGVIVESGPVQQIFALPQHPYTRALMGAIPRLHAWPERLTTIEGAPPQSTGKSAGCPFEPRCRYRIDRCAAEMPALLELEPGHKGACWVAQAGGIDG
jgi:oligopeptide/dipeptide ABC transporter ATP-binding protein